MERSEEVGASVSAPGGQVCCPSEAYQGVQTEQGSENRGKNRIGSLDLERGEKRRR